MEHENETLTSENLEKIAGGDGKILYTAQCTKCGEKIGGSGCYDLSEAEEKVVKWNKYGCPKCGKKYCFKVVEK